MTHVMCKECGTVFKRITHKHLAHHGMTLEQYAVKWPDALIISDNTRAKLSTNSLAHFIEKYGEQGQGRYQEYRDFQSRKNTFDYKHTVHGWTREQFDEYNQNRASTRSNFIRRHGPDVGERKWQQYCEHQSIAGVALEWFTSKYGDAAGTLMYETVCKSKTHSISTYVNKYGSEEGPTRFKIWCDKRVNVLTKYASSSEKKFAESLVPIFTNCVVYSSLSKQFSSWDHEHNRVYFYDMVVPQLGLCIEYNGNYWHSNPKMYQPDAVHPHRGITAQEIWDMDEQKHDHLKARGYDVMVVWEDDWKYNQHNEIKRIVDYVERKNGNSG